MILKELINDLASEIGADASNAEERLLLVDKLNKSASELYARTDLIGSLFDQTFEVDKSHQHIALPYYVDKIRAVKQIRHGIKINLEDIRPLYHFGNWKQSSLKWRVLYRSALSASIENEAPVTVKLLGPEPTELKVTISGSTPLSDRTKEELVFAPGELEKTTLSNWTTLPSVPGIRLISKNRVTKNNLIVLDADGREISSIPNQEREAGFWIVKILDKDGIRDITDSCECFDILFKIKFSPFVDDYDEFPCSGYDDAIKWMALSHYYSGKEGLEFRAMGFEQKANALISEREKDFGMGIDKRIEIRPNPIYQAADFHSRRFIVWR